MPVQVIKVNKLLQPRIMGIVETWDVENSLCFGNC